MLRRWVTMQNISGNVVRLRHRDLPGGFLDWQPGESHTVHINVWRQHKRNSRMKRTDSDPPVGPVEPEIIDELETALESMEADPKLEDLIAEKAKVEPEPVDKPKKPRKKRTKKG